MSNRNDRGAAGTGPPPPIESRGMMGNGGASRYGAGGQYHRGDPHQQQRMMNGPRGQMSRVPSGQHMRGGNPQMMTGAPPYSGRRWQDPQRDNQIRREMIANIVHLLKESKPNCTKEFLQKLPSMAKRLEDKLYRYASSVEDYTNRGTLRQRLQKIALQISQANANGPPGAYGGRNPAMYANGMGSRGVGPPPSARTPPDAPPAKGRAKKMPSAGRGTKKGGRAAAAAQMPPQMHPGQMVHPGMHNRGAYQQSGGVPPRGVPPGGPRGAPAQRGRTGQTREMVLKQQQHRLLLLRHASKCMRKEGECQATHLCSQYKQLWQHIAKCKNQRCQTPHCVSSRYVLSHYHRCQDKTCAVCGPVREAIERHNKQRLERTKSYQSDRNGMQMPMGHPGRGRGMPMPRQMSQGSMGYPGQHPGMHNPNVPGGYGVPPRGMPVTDSKGGRGRGRGRKKKSDGAQNQAMPHIADPAQQQLMQQLAEAKERARREAEKAAALERKIQMMSQQGGRGVGGPPPVQSYSTGMPPAVGSVPPVQPMKRSGSKGSARSKGKGRTAAAKRKQGPTKAEPPTKKPNTAGKKGAGKNANSRVSSGGSKAAQAAKAKNAAKGRGNGVGYGVGANSMIKTELGRQNSKGSTKQGSKAAQLAAAQAQSKQQFRKRVMSGAETQALRSQSSLINTFTRSEIKAHIASLVVHSSQIKMKEWRKEAALILKTLKEQTYYWIFAKPVDPVQFNIPDYFDVIKHPMDLGTVQKKLDKGEYRTLQDFASDVRLTFNNAILYNPDTSDVNMTSKRYAQLFEKDYNNLIQNMRADEALKRQNENACRLCGGEKYIFEPPVYYCNGKCNQKIRRNAWYYTTPDNKQFYCSVCFQGWKKDTVELEDGSVIRKDELKKQKNMEVQEESWVQCNHCNRWYHQICALFNGKRNERSKHEDYHCAMCILRHMDDHHIDQVEQKYQPPRGHTAKDLPKCEYSNYLEARLKKRVEEARKEYAAEKGMTLDDVEAPGELCVRVVSCRDTEVFPRQGLERLYKGAPTNYPRSFPHRVKCLLLFERIDGVDVLIFGMYTQSYGPECPKPNSRCLYIAYLDSVFYFEPRFLRTPVYHEILSGCIAYEKKVCGITKTFIWACPPLSGDDYILYCHPKDQKTPKAEMLRNWYLKLLETSRKEGVVVSLDNLYDGYIQRLPNPCGIPNFDGDYWPGCTETFIEELEREKTDPKSVAPRSKRAYNKNKGLNSKNRKSKANSKKKKSKKSKYRKKSDGRTKDPTVVVDASKRKFVPPTPLPLVEVPQQDALTVKIGTTINQMKDDFIVVRMHHVCSGCSKDIDEPDEVYWLPKEYDPKDYDLDFTKNRYAPPYALCNKCYQGKYSAEFGKECAEPLPPVGTITLWKKDKNVKKEATSAVVKSETGALELKPKQEKTEDVQVKSEVGSNAVEKLEAGEAAVKTESGAVPPPPPPRSVEASTPKKEERPETEEITRILPEGQEAKLRNSWVDAPCGLKEMYPLRTDIIKKSIDKDPMMSCEFFDTRQQFLSLCQGNKYQFDELRRAKHTSMMVLYHLHNPKLDAFVTSCNACRATINGNRYTCTKCDYDLCEKCNADPKIKHAHPLKLKVADNQKSARQQKVRDKKVLLVHACSCNDMNCKNPLCPKMKAFLKHGRDCQKRVRGGCKICLKISFLLQLHGRHCTLPAGKCRVPNCAKTRELLRRHAARQQDRRIQMQNARMNAERKAAKAQRAAAMNGSNTPNTPQAATPSPSGQQMKGPAKGNKHAKGLTKG
mmetsp:Transcript_17915/g.20693  ORF Transcript_17915/g.20693 Transcript_17915/m.20693 type:complete len:1767 (+) Transcript_17915:908-6208(+)